MKCWRRRCEETEPHWRNPWLVEVFNDLVFDTTEKPEASVNRYGVKCGNTLEEWWMEGFFCFNSRLLLMFQMEGLVGLAFILDVQPWFFRVAITQKGIAKQGG